MKCTSDAALVVKVAVEATTLVLLTVVMVAVAPTKLVILLVVVLSVVKVAVVADMPPKVTALATPRPISVRALAVFAKVAVTEPVPLANTSPVILVIPPPLGIPQVPSPRK